MKDGYNRKINYMRLSVTDKCNFSCAYCKADDCTSNCELISFDELYNISKAAVDCGINKIRITGGEPLVRDGIIDFCSRLSKLQGLNELTMTTNGYLLKEYAYDLKKAGISRLNISMDTLNKDKFKSITNVDGLSRVLEGIDEAIKCGFDDIRINVVLIGGFNDDEIIDFVNLTKDHPYFIRFIELMPIGVCKNWSDNFFITSDKVLEIVKDLKRVSFNGVAETYKIDGFKGEVGLIRPMTNKFCDVCNRIRVTANGKLKPCLHSSVEYDLHNLSTEQLIKTILEAIANKPQSHNLNSSCFSETNRYMNEIGG